MCYQYGNPKQWVRNWQKEKSMKSENKGIDDGSLQAGEGPIFYMVQ